MSHSHSLHNWTHDHVFDEDRSKGEGATRLVVGLTFAFMAIEIAAGLAFGSMALLADGLHMGSHALALGVSVAAYAYARRHARSTRFSFGTGKVNALGAFAGAVLLMIFAAWMAIESGIRAFSPVQIAFDQAIAVAVLGLGVNLLSAWILARGGAHGHDHGHSDRHAHDHPHGHDHAAHAHGHTEGHGHGHGDLNLRSAYLHVLADALTSVLAIAALIGGRQLGWNWLDAAVGMLGAVLIARWGVGLIRDSAAVLLDEQAPAGIVSPLRQALEIGSDRIADLHVWRVAPNSYAAVVSLVTHEPKDPQIYRERIPAALGIRHASIEVNVCCDAVPKPNPHSHA